MDDRTRSRNGPSDPGVDASGLISRTANPTPALPAQCPLCSLWWKGILLSPPHHVALISAPARRLAIVESLQTSDSCDRVSRMPARRTFAQKMFHGRQGAA
jgi:hypothetical protein